MNPFPNKRQVIFVGPSLVGKDSTIKIIMNELSITNHYSSGDCMLEVARMNGCIFKDSQLYVEFLAKVGTDPEIDRQIDSQMCHYMSRHFISDEPAIFSGRIPHLFPAGSAFTKIALTCSDENERARRFNKRRLEEKGLDPLPTDEAIELISKRDQKDRVRLQALYGHIRGIRYPYNIGLVDLVVDTRNHRSGRETADEILKYLKPS